MTFPPPTLSQKSSESPLNHPRITSRAMRNNDVHISPSSPSSSYDSGEIKLRLNALPKEFLAICDKINDNDRCNESAKRRGRAQNQATISQIPFTIALTQKEKKKFRKPLTEQYREVVRNINTSRVEWNHATEEEQLKKYPKTITYLLTKVRRTETGVSIANGKRVLSTNCFPEEEEQLDEVLLVIKTPIAEELMLTTMAVVKLYFPLTIHQMGRGTVVSNPFNIVTIKQPEKTTPDKIAKEEVIIYEWMCPCKLSDGLMHPKNCPKAY